MEFFSHHGCFEQERIIGNKFIVNLSVTGDFSAAAKSDNLEDAINYQSLYDIVKREMHKDSSLLENVAQRVVDAIIAQFEKVSKIEITIDKLNPPLGGKLYASSVTVRYPKSHAE